MLDDARLRVAAVLGCRADELSFTGSGTQAVHLAVLGTVAARRRSVRGGRHITASAVEHSSVLHAARYCEQEGAQVTVVGVDQLGRVDAAEFAAALLAGAPPGRGSAAPAARGSAAPAAQGNAAPAARGNAAPAARGNAAPAARGNAAPTPRGNAAPPVSGHSASLAGVDAEPPGRPGRTVLACLQSANPEVGTIQPVEEAASACRRAAIPLLVDAAASAGRMPIPDGWSLLTASAHKWGGPAGLGVLAVRKGTRWRNPLPHDDREGGRVPGYPNVPAALAAATALEAMDTERLTRQTALRALTDRIRARIPDVVPDTVVYGEPVHRLPHIVTFCCLYVNGEALVTELDRAGFAVSSGSSCAADTLRPSHVLEAMGVVTHGNVRVSLPCATTEDTIERFLTVLPAIVAGLRGTAHHVVNT